MIVAIFGQHTPIGLVRLSTQLAVKKLIPIVANALITTSTGPAFLAEQASSLADDMGKSWDSIFGDADATPQR